MRDFRFWWALFVFFAALSVLTVQRGSRRWSRARTAIAARPMAERGALERRLRREGWRLACMVASLVAMTALVFAALMGAPAAAILLLRLVALGAVGAVLWLSLTR
ncbi:MAG TPA: hypothetical protein VJQ46_03835 [Gemmatimonadales bacterium]|nr:hypothetical protein [Gemmatimonadales bacterium]